MLYILGQPTDFPTYLASILYDKRFSTAVFSKHLSVNPFPPLQQSHPQQQPCPSSRKGTQLMLTLGLHAPRHEEASAPATISTQLTWQKYQLRWNHSKTEIRYPPMANWASKIQLPKSMRKFPSQLFCGAWSKPSSYTLITEIIINTKNSQIHPFSTWKILCGQGDMHLRDFASLSSIPTLCSSVRAAHPTLISIRPRQVIIWASWNLHAKLSCSTWAVRSGMLRTRGTDSLTVNRHSAKVDKQARPRHPLRQNCSQPEGSCLTSGVIQTWDPQASEAQRTEHMRHAQHIAPLAGKCGFPGARYVMPTSTQVCWGVGEGATEEALQHPGGSAPLPCAGGRCSGHQQRGMVKPQVRQQLNHANGTGTGEKGYKDFTSERPKCLC